jgi:hypothetical protein
MSIYLRLSADPDDVQMLESREQPANVASWKPIGPIDPLTGLIFLTELSVGAGIEGIGEDAFIYQGTAANISISLSVKTIGARTFAGCSRLSSITLPDVISIG